MKKFKLMLIALAGLALASCTDNEYSTRTSFTASASVGGVNLSTVPNFVTAQAGGVTLSAGNTVATFTCPAGLVSFNTFNNLTCDSAGGCDTTSIIVLYSNPIDTGNDVWTVITDTVDQNETATFFGSNNIIGSQYASGLVCILSSQVSYWS